MEIALKNFRKFKDFPGKDFGSDRLKLNDITLLVGKNNAGKSTLVKALILIIENLRRESNLPFSADAYFNFRSEDHRLHIDTFNRALCNSTEDKFIRFDVKIDNFIIGIEVEEADDIVLYNHLQEEEDATAPIRYLSIKDEKHGITVEIEPYKQSIKASFDLKDLYAKNIESVNKEIDELTIQIKELKEKLDALTNSNPSNLQDIVDLGEVYFIRQNRLKRLKAQRNKMVHNVTPEGFVVNTTDLYYNEGWRTQLPIIQELKALESLKPVSSQSDEYIINKSLKAAYATIKNYGEEFREMIDDLDRVLRSISFDYIQAHLASQEIMLNPNEPNNMMAKVVDEYVTITSKYDSDSSIKNFILKWLGKEPEKNSKDYEDFKDNNFEIGIDFDIKQYPGHNYVMKIQTQDGKWVNIADMGMGTNQLLILLFQVANNMVYRIPTLIIIEEPEQNLHPQLQTRLTNFMRKINKDQRMKIDFLIETHSEYLIRQAQVIIAESNFKDEADLQDGNPFAVYYFDEKKIVYPLEFGYKGMFKNDFGKGFMDESARLAFKILKGGRS